MPEYGRMLGQRNRYFHDWRQHLHPQLQILQYPNRETVTARVNTKVNQYIKVGMNVNFANMKRDGVRPAYNRYYSTWGEPSLADGKTLRKFIEGQTDLDQVNP